MFNWFRRQFSENETPKEEQQQPAPPTAAQPEATPASETEQLQADYLTWAKAAYQNIQRTKQAQASPATATEADAPSEAAVPEATQPEGTSAAAATPEPPEPLDASAPPTPPEDPASTAAEPTNVPVWMKKSDRSNRLERLRETAIAPETEEATAAEAAEVAESAAETVSFDEEFVWSARVLAEQGRRPEEVSEEEISWLKRLRQGLGKTRRGLVNQLKAIVGQGPLNQDAVMEIEALLLQADVGVEATDHIINTLQEKLRQQALPPEAAIAYLKQILRELLERPHPNNGATSLVPEKDRLNVWLITGVNGAGKTTTIGKLAHLAHKSGYRCLIAAADTFRAAAVEQVKAWGDRSQTPVIANPGKNTDPAAVVYDAISAAQSRNAELLFVDTAGRLQNKKNLMDELAKIRRIIDKKAPDAKVESLLVIDATLGQNGLRQAEVFSEVANLSGVVLTKLDSSAKGGVALAIAQQLNLPICFVGAGEGIEDLRPFSSHEFVEALLSE